MQVDPGISAIPSQGIEKPHVERAPNRATDRAVPDHPLVWRHIPSVRTRGSPHPNAGSRCRRLRTQRHLRGLPYANGRPDAGLPDVGGRPREADLQGWRGARGLRAHGPMPGLGRRLPGPERRRGPNRAGRPACRCLSNPRGEQFAFATVEQRLARGLPIEADREGTVAKPHQRPAADFGSVGEVASRVLGEWMDAGMVELRRGAIEIVNRTGSPSTGHTSRLFAGRLHMGRRRNLGRAANARQARGCLRGCPERPTGAVRTGAERRVP